MQQSQIDQMLAIRSEKKLENDINRPLNALDCLRYATGRGNFIVNIRQDNKEVSVNIACIQSFIRNHAKSFFIESYEEREAREFLNDVENLKEQLGAIEYNLQQQQ